MAGTNEYDDDYLGRDLRLWLTPTDWQRIDGVARQRRMMPALVVAALVRQALQAGGLEVLHGG